MPVSVRLDPHPVSDELVLTVTDLWDPTQEGLVISREVLRSEDEEGPATTIYLTDEELRWESLQIQLEAQLPTAELDRVLPRTSSWRDDAILLISTQCQGTKLRRVTRLEPTAPGRWRGDVLLRRDDVRDSLRILARLVRATDTAREGEARHAAYQGAVVAEAPPVGLMLDERRTPEGMIRFRSEDFRSSTNPWRAEHASIVFYFDAQDERPTLWLNSRYEKLRAALKSRATVGEDAVIRHLANAVLAEAVWTELSLVALGGAEIVEEDGTITEPSEWWKQAVLRRVLPRAFADTARDERLGQAVEQLRSRELIGGLVARLGTAVQEVVGVHSLVEKAVRAAETRETRS